MNPRQLTRRQFWIMIGTLAICAIILGLRKPDQLERPQFWAEDGFFYHQHFVHGWHTLIEAYNGYLHTIPRLIAGTSWWLDPKFAPAWFVTCAFAANLYVASRALSPRQPLRPRLALALAAVLVPDAFEVLLNVTNLQWVLAGGLLLLLIEADAETWPERVHDMLAVVLLGLTGPFCLLLTPFFLWRALQRKTGWSWILAASVATASIIQFGCILQYHEPQQPSAIVWPEGVAAVGMQVAGSLFGGIWLKPALALPLRWGFTAVSIALIMALALREGHGRRERIALAGALIVFALAGVYRCRWSLASLNTAGYGSRYFFPVQMALLWLLATSLSRAGRWSWFAASLLTVALVANLSRLREPALVDLHWAHYTQRIRDGEAVTIPINPPGWTISLPPKPKPLELRSP